MKGLAVPEFPLVEVGTYPLKIEPRNGFNYFSAVSSFY